jgi:hypothetical protein
MLALNKILNNLDARTILDKFYNSLTTGEHWDTYSKNKRPDLKWNGSEYLGYTFDAFLNSRNLPIVEFDINNEEHVRYLRSFIYNRFNHVLIHLPKDVTLKDNRIVAHRLIDCDFDNLKEPLGVYWTYALREMVEPSAYWSPKGRDCDPLVIEAAIRLDLVDWESTILSGMCYMLGDTEKELRVFPDRYIDIEDCHYLKREETIDIDRVMHEMYT